MVSRTPWGPPQDQRDLGMGVTWVRTAGHGGLHISDPSILPDGVTATFLNGPHWAEEDNEAVIVAALLYDKLDIHLITSSSHEEIVESAKGIAGRHDIYGSWSGFLDGL